MYKYDPSYSQRFLRLVAMITLILPVLTLAQIGVTEFPKISFVDPYWAGNRSDPSFYYDDIRDMGINLVVTNGQTSNVDTMQNHHLQLWNADLGSAGYYVNGMENLYTVRTVNNNPFPYPDDIHGGTDSVNSTLIFSTQILLSMLPVL